MAGVCTSTLVSESERQKHDSRPMGAEGCWAEGGVRGAGRGSTVLRDSSVPAQSPGLRHAEDPLCATLDLLIDYLKYALTQ